MIDFRSRLTRREALELLAVGTAAAVLPGSVAAQSPTFPRGAIIRTVLKDYAPEDLRGGGTPGGTPAPAQGPPGGGRAAGPPPAPPGPDLMSDPKLMAQELAIAKSEGVACIV